MIAPARLLSPEQCQEFACTAEILRREINRHRETFPHADFKETLCSRRVAAVRKELVLLLTANGVCERVAVETVRSEARW